MGIEILEFLDPTDEKIEEIKRAGLEKDDILDSLDEDELARISKKEKYIQIILKGLFGEEFVRRTTVGIFLKENKVFILRKRYFPPIEETIKRYKSEEIKTVEDFFEVLFQEFNKYFSKITKRLEHQVERLRETIYKRKVDVGMLIWGIKEDLTNLLFTLDQNKEVFLSISKGEIFKIKRKEKFKDLYQDFMQIMVTARILLQRTDSLFQAFNTMLSNDLNKRIEKLTIITLVLSIPSLIAALYGMNFKVIPLATHPLGFFIVSSISIMLGVMSYLLFKRMLR